MKLVIAPDSFKGSMSSPEVALSIAAGVREVYPAADISLVPLADGGEGTVDAVFLAASADSRLLSARVTGPLGALVQARYADIGNGIIVLEMASASGLGLIDAALRDPLIALTYGTGELIAAALAQPGVRRLIIGLGGSATNDGGVGALWALGVRFLDGSGKEVPAAILPERLDDVGSVDAALSVQTEAEIVLACDVTNPLIGPSGASVVFGPQKGASPDAVAALDKRLARFSNVLDDLSVSRGGSRGVGDRPGAGAAGGLAAGLMALYPHAVIRSGIDIVLDIVNFDAQIADADLVITGEGKLDEQTLSGKTIAGVLRRTKAANIRTIALAGAVDADVASRLRDRGLESAHGIIDLAENLADAIARGPELLRKLAATVARAALGSGDAGN